MASAADNYLLEPASHAEAVAWIADKPTVSREVFDGLLPELRARAFVVAGIEDARVAAEIREIVAGLPSGESWDAQKKKLVEKLGPFLSPDDPDQKAAKARAEILLRTHGFQAYQVAQHRVMREQEDVFPFWQYLSMEDEKVRAGHAALHEKIAPAASPFWKDHSPPWQWGCRCRKVPLMGDEADEARAEDARLPPERRRLLEGPGLRLAEEGRLYDKAGRQISIKSGRQKGNAAGFVFDPDALTLPVGSLKDRYDAVTWREFEARAKGQAMPDGQTVWGWLTGVRASASTRGRAAQAVVSLADRKAEVARLLATRPARRSPPSDHIVAAGSQDAHAQMMRKAALLADHAHDDGGLRSLTMTDTVLDDLADGEFRNGVIGVRRDAAQPLLVSLHEVGHGIARDALKPEALERIKAAAQETLTWEMVIKRGRQLGYWLDAEEVFCRAYTQLVAERTRDPELLRELADVLGSPLSAFEQWPSNEFAVIRRAVELELKKIGWL